MDLPERLEPFHAVLAAFVAASAAVVVAAWNLPLIWDSSVYVAMGKYLYTGGEFGFWEIYRPPVLPVVLGALWRLGLPFESYRVFSVLVSTASAATVYYVFRRMEDRLVALTAAGATVGAHAFIHFTANPLTGIPASALVVASVYMAWREKFGTAGILIGLAFLTRFPAAVAGPAVAGWVVIRAYQSRDIRQLLREWTRLGTGFTALAFPYLLAAQIVYGDFTAPFSSGYTVTAATGNQYLFGLKYLVIAAKNSPLMAIAPVGIYAALRSRTDLDGLMLLYFTCFYGFFTYFPLKIDRYALLFLPIIGYFAGTGLRELSSRFGNLDRGKLEWVIAVLLIATVAFNGYVNYEAFSYSNPGQQQFFDRVSELNGTVASNDPRVNVYGNFVYMPVPVRVLDGVWDKRDEVDHWAIDTCSWDCRNAGPSCEENIREFENRLETYEKTFETTTGNCNYTVRRTE